jgi:CRP-like cAMP-binding protein
VEYSREDQAVRTSDHIEAAALQLGELDLFSTLSLDARRGLARAAGDHLFSPGEAIVRQGEQGSSMFVVLKGRVTVVLEPSGQGVATIDAGGFFGEMSMLTGDPRTATVRAVSEVQVLEIAAADTGRLMQATPGLAEHISEVVAARRAELAQAEVAAASAASGHHTAPQSLLARIQAYLNL